VPVVPLELEALFRVPAAQEGLAAHQHDPLAGLSLCVACARPHIRCCTACMVACTHAILTSVRVCVCAYTCMHLLRAECAHAWFRRACAHACLHASAASITRNQCCKLQAVAIGASTGMRATGPPRQSPRQSPAWTHARAPPLRPRMRQGRWRRGPPATPPTIVQGQASRGAGARCDVHAAPRDTTLLAQSTVKTPCVHPGTGIHTQTHTLTWASPREGRSIMPRGGLAQGRRAGARTPRCIPA